MVPITKKTGKLRRLYSAPFGTNNFRLAYGRTLKALIFMDSGFSGVIKLYLCYKEENLEIETIESFGKGGGRSIMKIRLKVS